MKENNYINSKLRILFFVLLPAVLFNMGCAGKLHNGTDIDPNDKKRSLVYGYIDMSDAPSWGGIDWVSLKQLKPYKDFFTVPVNDKGLFFHISLPAKSSVQIESFGRDTRFYSNTAYTYSFSGAGRNGTYKKIRNPGIYYLGSYKYKVVDSGSIFKDDGFKMVDSKKPTEKTLLKKILKIMLKDKELAVYKHQIRRIKKRIKSLK